LTFAIEGSKNGSFPNWSKKLDRFPSIGKKVSERERKKINGGWIAFEGNTRV
jgi:hypothetical protein